MENIYKIIKLFLLNTVNDYININNEDETKVNLPLFTEENIKFGTIDPFKNPSQKMLCSVYPDSQNFEDSDIAEMLTASAFTLTVVNKLEDYETLLSQSCAYSAILTKAIIENYNLQTDIDDEVYAVDDVQIGERKFYPNAGTVDKQATAIEINLTIYKNTTIGD